MKKILQFLALGGLLIISHKNNAQISLDTILPMSQIGMGYDFKTVQISENETKYFFGDTLTNTFSLYNMDFTPFMTYIPVPEPFDMHHGLMQVLYITRTLFDCDSSNIEYAYYSPQNIYRPFRIMRTDGTVLFKKDSANGPYCYGTPLGGSDFIRPIINTSSGAKLFLQDNNSSKFVYSLCGTLPTDVFDFTMVQQSMVKIYPNPTANTLTFEINPPDNMNDYELVILDNIAKEIKREKVNFTNNKHTIDVSNLTSGVYFYSLCTKNKAYQSGKFIITK